jgi:hypothetical protein
MCEHTHIFARARQEGRPVVLAQLLRFFERMSCVASTGLGPHFCVLFLSSSSAVSMKLTIPRALYASIELCDRIDTRNEARSIFC